MINFKDSNITKLLPNVIGGTPEVKAIGYAVNKQINKLIEAINKTYVWSNISGLDSDMLDVLAAELRTHYYNENLDVETKRKLVIGTIERYKKAGTVAAVEELISIVFGNGKVEEWFEYGGQPHHFRVKTSNPITIGEEAEEFLRLLESIKRKSSHLDEVGIEDLSSKKIYVGVTSMEVENQRYVNKNNFYNSTHGIYIGIASMEVETYKFKKVV